jgi:predicted ATPase
METRKPHPFGELLRQHRARKPGLTQARLAHAMGYDEAVVIRMAGGKKDLTGPSGRDRVLSIIAILHEEGVLSSLDEANALLAAAGQPPLYAGLPQEAALLHTLVPATASPSSSVLRYSPPASLTALIGRDRELDEVASLLGVARLVTLTGAGGGGKTRFALEVATRMSGSFANGACFVSLAPAGQPEHVAPAIVQALGITPIPDLPARETVIRFLRDKAMLLVLDNFEHVLEAATLVTDLLAAAPALKVLVTSREALRLNGEHIYPVEPLEVADAARLFVVRAQAAWPDFKPVAADREVIASVCQRLDGLPLAIELAAARVRQFPPQQLLARLSQSGSGSLNLLTHGPRDLPARQQTLRQTIEWSYRLLSDDEQRVFRALSIFAGGAALEQIERVAMGISSDPGDLIYSLTARNLVRVDASPEREVRFWMLELIREFARDKLAEAGELRESQRAHAEAIALLAEQARPHILGAMPHTQQPWIERMQREADNIRAMMAWSLSAEGDPILGLRLAAALTWHLRAQTHLWDQEGFNWVNQLCRRALPAASPAVWAWTVMMAGFPPIHGAESVAASEESLRYAQLSEEEDCIANAMISVGVDLNHLYSDGRGTLLIEEGLALARQTGYTFLISYGLHYLAQARRDYEDRPDDALRLLQERIALCKAADHRMLIAPSILMAAGCALHQLDFAGTWAYVQQARGNVNLLGWDGCDQYRYSVEAMLGLGDTTRARVFAEEGYELVRQLGNPPTTAFWLALLAKVAVATGQLDEAAVLLAQSRAAYADVPSGVGGLIDLLENLHVIPAYIAEISACLAAARGEFARAARLFSAGVAVRQTHHVPREPYFEHWQTPYIAKVRAALGDAAYEAAYAEGYAMPLERAIELALGEDPKGLEGL